MDNEPEITREEPDINLTEDDLTEPLEERVIDPTDPEDQEATVEPSSPPNGTEEKEVEVDLEQDDLTQPLEELSAKSSYLNLAFFDVTRPLLNPEPLKRSEGFLSGRTYRLVVGLSPQQDERFVSPEKQPAIPRPTSEEEVLTLLVVVRLEGDVLSILSKRMDTIEWPRDVSSTKNAEFFLQAATVNVSVRVPLHIAVYYKNYRLFSAVLSILITPSRHAGEEPNGIPWQ
ncbi:MAG TPA: hypothetical protein VKU00_24175 [Chthonomonadaceae bacterium]|nr:hypothetical protein [Chthonomonadaceae bacterium]